jgi:hypothetical protein
MYYLFRLQLTLYSRGHANLLMRAQTAQIVAKYVLNLMLRSRYATVPC